MVNYCQSHLLYFFGLQVRACHGPGTKNCLRDEYQRCDGCLRMVARSKDLQPWPKGWNEERRAARAASNGRAMLNLPAVGCIIFDCFRILKMYMRHLLRKRNTIFAEIKTKDFCTVMLFRSRLNLLILKNSIWYFIGPKKFL